MKSQPAVLCAHLSWRQTGKPAVKAVGLNSKWTKTLENKMKMIP